MDKERILSKFDQLEGYLEELEKIKPVDFEIYESSIEKKRACERLLQISVETVIDICNIIVSELKTGLPSDEEDMFSKMRKNKIISKEMEKDLIGMKGLRNILVHRYGEIEDELVFEVLSEKLTDFEKFKKEVLLFMDKTF
jgi:uncharacterized protein YutE (UPF0331/DUF86 family)